MRKLALAAAVAAVFASPVVVSTAHAQAAAAPASDHTFTGNMTIGTDYRFRGVTQTYKGPTIQGGVDYSHSSGFYLGNWNSNVSGLQYSNGNSIEMDFYGGWKKSFGDFGLDLGVLYYYYDTARWAGTGGTFGKYNNGELYIGGSWKWISAKYSYAVTDYFGLNGNLGAATFNRDNTATLGNNGGSKGTQYFQVDANYEFAPKWNVIGHIGHTTVKNYGALSYTDYKLGVTYDLSGWILGAALVDTDAKKQWYYVTSAAKGTKSSADTTVVLTLSKSF